MTQDLLRDSVNPPPAPRNEFRDKTKKIPPAQTNQLLVTFDVAPPPPGRITATTVTGFCGYLQSDEGNLFGAEPHEG